MSSAETAEMDSERLGHGYEPEPEAETEYALGYASGESEVVYASGAVEVGHGNGIVTGQVAARA